MIAPASLLCTGNGPSHVKEAAASVMARVQQFEDHSRLKRPEGTPLDDPLDLEWSNVRIDSLLGTGSFSVVYKARVNKLAKKMGTPDRMFALKMLSNDTICCNESFVTGAVDLALEAKILSKLHHENVIEVYGIKGGNIADSFANAQGGFFLVMDLLEETLDHRLEHWRLEESKNGAWGNVKAFFNRKKVCQKRLEAIVERLDTTIMGVVRGMEYIHSQNVILRDLKPHNIGFDKTGKVRIFDFGLARELTTGDNTANLPRCNTGVAGTLRYISPENALGEPCGLSADVYSFAILLYEIITLQVPFSDIKLVSDFKDKVIRGRHRPDLKFVPSTLLQDLLKDSWDPNPNARPTFAEVHCIVSELTTSDMLTQDGEWRKFVFKKTKPTPQCGNVGCTMKDHSSVNGGAARRLSGSGHHRRFSGSHHSHSKGSCNGHHHHHHHHHYGSHTQGEIDILRAELKREEHNVNQKAAMSGSYHGSFNDQTRSFMENISFNSRRSAKH